jgi:hypothetical protein
LFKAIILFMDEVFIGATVAPCIQAAQYPATRLMYGKIEG